MEEYRIPTDDELCELANDYIDSLSDEDFPISEENLTEDFLEKFLNKNGYKFVESQMDNLIGYIMSASDMIYSQMVEDASQEFRYSLNDVIENANEILSDEDKLKIMVEVASNNFCKY